jgi:hypothetical protein
MGYIEKNRIAQLKVLASYCVECRVKLRPQFCVPGSIPCVGEERICDVIVIEIDNRCSPHDLASQSSFSGASDADDQNERRSRKRPLTHRRTHRGGAEDAE